MESFGSPSSTLSGDQVADYDEDPVLGVHSKYVEVHGDRLMFIDQDSNLVSYSLSSLLDSRKDFKVMEKGVADFEFETDNDMCILWKRGEFRVSEKTVRLYDIFEAKTPIHWTTFHKVGGLWILAAWEPAAKKNHYALLEHPQLTRLDTLAVDNISDETTGIDQGRFN